ncbi:MAG TPA: WecB/TagA/CpsF family glycosyltransferase [Candidatus Eisenbacteria bacterium]|nr:WecB/TagA/CpsF family glycosyltransferase [Candidatus Eisenbacteria bacterium]
MQKSQNHSFSENSQKTYSNSNDLVKKNVLGVGITDASSKDILKYIVQNIQKSASPYYIVTPNPEMIVLSHKNSDFQMALNGAKIALNDGVGVGLAAQSMGISLTERFTGVDLVEKLCKEVSDWPITVGFLGGGPGVAELTSNCLVKKYPNLRVSFIGQEWSKEGFDLAKKYQVSSSKYYESTKPKIHNTKYLLPNTDVIDILFVAFGAPKQEFWMQEHVGKIPVKVLVGVGGAFDYISGKVPRAPKVVRSMGMEWLFRLAVQPWRIKRQLALVEFVWMVIKEKLNMSFRGKAEKST